MRHSLTSLQERLSNTVTEMRAQAQEMEKLKEAIQSKAGPLKLAQTRLNMRTQKIRRFDIIIVTIQVQVQVQSPKSKVKRTWSDSILLLYHPPYLCLRPHKLFSATRHPIELKFSQ